MVHALGDQRRLVHVRHAVEQHRELVAAEAGDGVRRPDGRLQPPGDGDQQPVSHLVAERVVDELEAVEVEEQDRRGGGRVGALGAADRLVEPVEEQHAVRQAGERVVQRVVLEALLGPLAVGDVGLAADDPQRSVLRVPDRHPAREHPAVGAVAVLDPVLVLEVVRRAGQVGVERLRERGAVVRVHAPEPLAAGVAELGLRVAEHRLPARGEVQPVLAHVPVPQPVVGALERERVALLGLLQPGERALMGDRVAQRALEHVEARDVLGDAGLGGRDVGVAVGAVVEQQDRRVRGVGEDRLRELEPAEVGVDQERVVRVLLQRGVRGLWRRHPVDLVARVLDRRQRVAHGRMLRLARLYDEDRCVVGQLGHDVSGSGGRVAASSQ